MPAELYERRVMERLHTFTRWENQPAHDAVTIADLDDQEIVLTLDTAIRLGRLDAPRQRDLESILRGLGLIVQDRLINAAVALYGQSTWLEAYYPQLVVRLARFRGTDRLADFTDNRQEWGHAFDTLRRSERFLRDFVPIAGRIVSGQLEREDRPLYPPRATREAIANAICHREYGGGGGAVTVAMYDDRLEIINPGRLPFGLTPEHLSLPHESRPWNPVIAGVLYRAGIIERWGSGTLNMVEWSTENGAPPPNWTERADSVCVTFWPAAPFGEDERGAESGPEPGTLQGSILLLLGPDPLSKSDIAKGLGRRSVTGQVNEAVASLMSKRLIEYTIPDKPRSRLQRYRLTTGGQRWRNLHVHQPERVVPDP